MYNYKYELYSPIKAKGERMKDERTLSYINLFAIFGSISELMRLDPKAAEIVGDKPITLEISVKGGPVGRLAFADGGCKIFEGAGKCDIRLPFSSPEKFNGMIDGAVTPVPNKGFTKLGFLLKKFIPLTDLLTKYLRPTDEDMKDPEFFRISTLLTFYVVSEALSQIGNNDPVGQASASYIVDGSVKLAISDVVGASIVAKDNVLKTVHEMPESFFSYMVFDSIEIANDLFTGKVNSVATVGKGKIRIGGMISQIDNVNRILDRVSLYLA